MSFSPIQLKEDAGGPVVFDGLAQGGGGGSQPFAEVQVFAAPTIASGVTIPFDTVVADSSSYWDAPNNQFVVPAGKGGIYLVGAAVFLLAGADWGNVFATLATSGAAANPTFAIPFITSGGGGWENTSTGSAAMRLDAGDSLSLFVTWDGAPTAPSTTLPTTLWLQRMGDAP